MHSGCGFLRSFVVCLSYMVEVVVLRYVSLVFDMCFVECNLGFGVGSVAILCGWT